MPKPFSLISIPTLQVLQSRVRLPFSSEYRWASCSSIRCFGFSLPPSRPSPGPLVIKSLRTRVPIKDHSSGRVPKWKCSKGRETPVLCSQELKITLLSRDYLSPPLTISYWICWPFNRQFNWYHKRIQTAKPIPTILKCWDGDEIGFYPSTGFDTITKNEHCQWQGPIQCWSTRVKMLLLYEKI